MLLSGYCWLYCRLPRVGYGLHWEKEVEPSNRHGHEVRKLLTKRNMLVGTQEQKSMGGSLILMEIQQHSEANLLKKGGKKKGGKRGKRKEAKRKGVESAREKEAKS